MKHILYILLCLSFIMLCSCSNNDELRQDVDDLKARFDELKKKVNAYNNDIASYDDLLSGANWIVDITEDEKGFPVVKLNNGNTLNFASEDARYDYSPFRVGFDEASQRYVWFYNDAVYKLNGEIVPALGTDGIVPQIRVSDKDRWEFSFDGGRTWQIGDSAIPQTGASFFDSVRKTDSGGNAWQEGVSEGFPCLTFVWTAGGTENVVTIPTFGGLKLTVEAEKTDGTKEFVEDFTPSFKPIEISKGGETTVNIRQKGVEKIVVGTFDVNVNISDNKGATEEPTTGEIPGTMVISACEGFSGNVSIYVKIFSKEGFCKLLAIPVTVLE